MSMKSMKHFLTECARLLGQIRDALDESPHPLDTSHLIEDFDVMVGCRCPCGSNILHRLTLVSTAECIRCGRTIGIRSLEYFRPGPAQQPKPRITVGFVHTQAFLRTRKTIGIH
jgi:hypothetical protein